MGYQVSYSLKEESIYQQEIDALIKLNAMFPLEKMCIITRDEERAISHDSGAVIEVIPIWKWILID